ncbi:uncharacterized protein LOC131240639 isoform X2 [Magnolia sinica]|uniref:uncharacterized protein LOC131240639 isoform X2 n=1 Tax=Magnolia sinica TaxID=86752 RepID=UPI00265B5A56|nr:uncharacterized protein LOC131240639 isoform X2 [Magnolia sinica]
MREFPSLLSLCAKVITMEVICGDQHLQDIFELPPDLVDYLLMHSPPLALQKLHEVLYGDFNTAWKILFHSRWPEGVRQIQPIDCMADQDGITSHESMICDDWQQMYWEAHLQDCLDEAAETALLPSFGGCIGEIMVSDTIVNFIGYKGDMGHSTHDYSSLSYHCQQFGCYVRYLRLSSALCVAETCELFRDSKLQRLVLRGIKSKNHVDGACKLLNQNSETLLSLEFIHCRLPPTALNEICDSLYTQGFHRHGIQYFSVKSSRILESNSDSVPTRFLSFLSSGRSLCALKLCDNRLGPNSAKMVFDALLNSSSGLSTLDLSDNYIAGWLSTVDGRFSSCPTSSSSAIDKSLRSLHVLNLRGSNLRKNDVEDLKSALAYAPNLQSLDISDNLIGDDGIRSLIPYFIDASERASTFVDIKVENCNLSCIGATQLLTSLSTLKSPLNTLSIADNDLGSDIAAPLAKFLGTSHVKVLNIEDIELGPSGFLELDKGMPEALELVRINLSKNRGGIEAAKYVYKLILRAPELAVINAGYNFMPAESLAVICSALKLSKGKLERLDLTGNTRCCQPTQVSKLAEFCFRGKPIVILPSLLASAAPYDDDP